MRIAWLAIGLPWADGLSFMFTQVPGGPNHLSLHQATPHAVDIAMPEGVPIVAAREGLVEAVEAHHGATSAKVLAEHPSAEYIARKREEGA